MLHTRRSGGHAALVCILLFCTRSDGRAQVAAGAGQAAERRGGAAATLAQGWAAIQAGRPGEAAALADTILDDPWYGHDAIAMRIAAGVAAGGAPAGLDPYERWLQTTGHEDPFLLRPVAIVSLGDLAGSSEARLRFAALGALAAAGDRGARQTLIDAAQAGRGSVEASSALAELGDRGAIARLEAEVAAGGSRDKTAVIVALRRTGGPGAASAIAKALTDPAPPSRIAAANAIAEMGARDAIPALKAALNDPDPAVRFMVSAALARLGDPQGNVTMETLAASPLGDMRLFAAEAEAEKNAAGSWTRVAQSLLGDPDPLLRVSAAELLLKKGADPAAAGVLVKALGDPNPGVRAAAARIVPEAAARGALELSVVRGLLRDPLPDVRLGAARAILAMTMVKTR
jgi:HEAT repeat protein